MASIVTEILIDAPLSQVWSTLIDFEDWKDWNSGYENIQLQGLLQVDTPITFTTRLSGHDKPQAITAYITSVKAERALTWVGCPLPRWLEWVIYGQHWFRLENAGKGKTELSHGETMGGVLSFLVPEDLRRKVEEMLETFNRELKARVERETQ